LWWYNKFDQSCKAESPAKSLVKQSSLKSFVDSPKKINSNLKEKITAAIAEVVVKDYL
jgi:hypothetical protein